MNRRLNLPLLIALLIFTSSLIYLIQIIVFRRPGETYFYLLQDLAFIPVNVLLVTLGLSTFLSRRERQSKMEKVSIVINEFFTESGILLIRAFNPFITGLGDAVPSLCPAAAWQDLDFSQAAAVLGRLLLAADSRRASLDDLRQSLTQSKNQILRLFENANLIEHDRFTDMLWAVYHVYDELHSRTSLDNLPASDLQHLSIDIQRAVRLLFTEWIEYMRLLKKRYPYLYSLAVRKCPFEARDVVIRE
jgi:hypothetical protein